jgi:hypothetical protein
MSNFSRFLVLALLPFVSSCEMKPASAASGGGQNNRAHQPGGAIVVELFQSQGCSSCPPANAALNVIAGRNDVIALSYAVTYWDRLGWKDIFASPAFTNHQYAYAKSLGKEGVYTPQIVLNGKRAIVGNGEGELESAIARTPGLSTSPTIVAGVGSVTIGAGKGSGDIILVRFDPRVQLVSIRAGENNGRKLPHRNIVRQLVQLGEWNGQAATIQLPKNTDPAWQSVVIVQTKHVGPILGARKI